MGQQVSQNIRSQLEHCTLEEILADDKCIEELQRHLTALPKRSHTNLAKVLVSWTNTPSKDSDLGSQPHPPPKGEGSLRKDNNSVESRLSPLWHIRSKDIGIPQSVAEALKQNHCGLLRQSSKNGIDLQSPEDHYEYTCSVETGRTLDRILWRFLTTFYYDLISELDATKKRLSTTETGGVAFVVAVICRSGKHDPDIVRKKVMCWAKVGRRYRGFMNGLCTGCLILFPEQTSDLVWEKYVPIKGDMFSKVIQFLRDLGMVEKCEQEGWNGLSDKILSTLRQPFRCLVAFQFQPDQQSQIGGAANSSLAPVTSDGDILDHERVEIQDMDVDNPPSSRTLGSRALPTLAANRVIKKKRVKGTASVRRQLQSFARDITAQAPLLEKSLPLVVRQSDHVSSGHMSEMQHETPRRNPQGLFPRAQTQCWASAPNDPGRQYLATNHQDSRLLSSQVSINDRGRDPLSDISLNAASLYPTGTDSAQYMQNVISSPSSHPRFVSPPGSQVHRHCHVDQGRGESISDTLRRERTGIRALLNYDNNTPITVSATAQDSLQGLEDSCTDPGFGAGAQSFDEAAPAGIVKKFLRAIQFNKHTLHQIVINRPTDILGEIWFGSPAGFEPCISLRLSKALGDIVKLSGQEVVIPNSTPNTNGKFEGVYSIELECFRQLIQRDGFGTIFWYEIEEHGFVSVQVIDKELMADFIQASQAAIDVLPILDTVSTSSSA